MIRKIGLILIFIIVLFYNSINYFFIIDRGLQWRIALTSIATITFIFSLITWLNELKNNSIKTILSGYLTAFFLIDMMGTFLGYNLHSKGFALILFLICILGIVHFIKWLWVNFL